jgi:NAD-dependent SIR2 family protein deacetylase
MMYARGTYSKAQCDRCGQTVRYGTLKAEYKNDKRTGMLTCPDCWDPAHPQDLPKRHKPDPTALRQARPRNEFQAIGDVNNSFSAPPNGQSYEDYVKAGN